MTFKLSIVIPVRNEGLNLRVMLRILQAAVEAPHEIIVVYDSPDDDSIPAVRKFNERNPEVRLVHNTIGRGATNAIKAGAAAAMADYVLIFAADDAGPVLAIEDMLALMDAGCDLVSVTRYADGGRRLGGSVIGGIISRIANTLFHSVGGMDLTDATTGIKMFRRSLLERFPLEASPQGWAGIYELAIKAQLAGLRLGEVPIVSIDRLFGGESTFRIGPWIAEYARWFFWGSRKLRALRGPRPKVLRPRDLPS